MQFALGSRLDAGGRVEIVPLEDVDELPRTAVRDVADVNVIAQQQQKWIVADEPAGLIDGMSKTFWRVLLGKVESLAKSAKLFRLPDRPLFPGKAFGRLRVEPLEIITVEVLFARLRDDADFFDPRADRFLADDLNHRLGDSVAVDEGKHFFLHCRRSRVLTRPPTRGGDDGFADF